MKTKTPGPLPLLVHDNKDGSYTVVTAQGNFYAKTYSELDARLIAAGPSLLEAAESCVIGLSGQGSIPFMISMLRGAIAQTKGKEAR